MLLLMFRAADEWYAVAADRVVEVVPRVGLRALPHAPSYLAGLFNYRGRVVPALDLGLLMGSAPCRPRLSTRIIVASCPRAGGPGENRVGLIAEQVNDVRSVTDAQVVSRPMPLEHAPYLGSIVRVDEGLVQCLEVGRLVPEPLREALFGEPGEGP